MPSTGDTNDRKVNTHPNPDGDGSSTSDYQLWVTDSSVSRGILVEIIYTVSGNNLTRTITDAPGSVTANPNGGISNNPNLCKSNDKYSCNWI